MNGATAAAMLRRKASLPDHETGAGDDGTVILTREDALAIADLLKPKNGDAPITHAEIVRMREFIHHQGMQLLSMGAAMRLMRVYVLTSIEFEESGEVAQYLAAWIDNGKWLPHKWPEQWPGVCKFLLDIGFVPQGGLIALPMDQIGDRAAAEMERQSGQ